MTSYLRQHEFDFHGHLTIENKLKVEKSFIISKNHNSFPHEKTLCFRFFYCTVNKDPPAQNAKITKTDNRRQTMGHIELCKSFEMVNLCEKNDSNLHLC